MIRDRILTEHDYLLQQAADACETSRELVANARAAVLTARRLVSHRSAGKPRDEPPRSDRGQR